ncbi:MAG: twin-arginine translocase TatA/TatE family subunit [Candidatus Thermoplasmatota archaeon]
MAFLGLGNTELLVIAVVVLLLFGATAIPKLARGLGQAKGQFQAAKKEFDAEAAKAAAAPPAAVSDEQLRSTAKGLGIDPAGKSSDELKRLIAQKVA